MRLMIAYNGQVGMCYRGARHCIGYLDEDVNNYDNELNETLKM